MFRIVCCLIFLLISGTVLASVDQINASVRRGDIGKAVGLTLFNAGGVLANSIHNLTIRQLYTQSRSWSKERRESFTFDLSRNPTLNEVNDLISLSLKSRTLGEIGRQGAFHGTPPKAH